MAKPNRPVLFYLMIGFGSLAALGWVGIAIAMMTSKPTEAKVEKHDPAKEAEKVAKAKTKRLEDAGKRLQKDVEAYVLKRLKAPSTAKINLTHGTDTAQTRIIVKGTVDSQNSFGAMIRSEVVAIYNAETLEYVDLIWNEP